MAHKYFTEDLLEKSSEIDLSNIFADKQQRAKELLNTNYSLPQIVDWLRDSSGNFKSQEGYFIDLDLAIKRIVNRYYESTNTKNPFDKIEEVEIEGKVQPRASVEVGTSVLPSVATEVDEKTQEIMSAIEFLKEMADTGDEQAKEALDFLSSII